MMITTPNLLRRFGHSGQLYRGLASNNFNLSSRVGLAHRQLHLRSALINAPKLRQHSFSSLAVSADDVDVRQQFQTIGSERPKPATYFLPFKYRIPEKAERYSLGRKVGEGNFATVYEALDTVTKEMVAVKMMNKATTPRQLCQQELRILEEIRSDVGHKRLTPIKDVFETPDDLCFVLELFHGGDFYEHVGKEWQNG